MGPQITIVNQPTRFEIIGDGGSLEIINQNPSFEVTFPEIQTAAPGSSSLRFDFSQPTPSATWTIAHNLGKRPLIRIFTLGGVEVEALPAHLSDNVTQIHFDLPFAGTAVALA